MKAILLIILVLCATLVGGCLEDKASCPTCSEAATQVTVLDKLVVNDATLYNENIFYILASDDKIYRVDRDRHDVFIRMRIGHTYEVRMTEGKITEIVREANAPEEAKLDVCPTFPLKWVNM